MEQWQFLIQKEDESTWHSLEKPRIKIMEGRYRVVARSNRTNADVEVRVTHFSSTEVPPRRRIQKRKRRTNAEGLTAVIPFTYLKSGIWELQCSGDLMSDLLGTSWKYTLSLEIIPSVIEGNDILTKGSSKNSDKHHQVRSESINTSQAKSKIKNFKSSSNSPSSNHLNTNDAESVSSNFVKGASSNLQKTNIPKPIPPNSSKSQYKLKTSSDKVVSEKTAQKLRKSLQAKKTYSQKALSQKPLQKAREQPLVKQNKAANNKPVEQLPDSVKVTSHKDASAFLVQKPSEKSQRISNKAVSKKSAEKSPPKSEPASNKAGSQKPDPKGDLAIIEQNSTPVRLKGDTAEQILQNLIDLALPFSEPLILDENLEDDPIAPPLPLQLTLNRVNYVERWGETITLDGIVQLKQTTNKQISHISKTEVEIELRSPLNSELLKSVRKSNPDQSLPFAIASSIDIPSYCSSKLLLGEIKIYGVVSSTGFLELLASQSFTITADIKELLAITIANPKTEVDDFSYSTEELSPPNNASQMIEPAVSLDLQLFNLVKTAKPEQCVSGIPSTKKSLPPHINPRNFRRRVTAHSPKLPTVPGYQEKIDQYINEGYVESYYGSNITDTSFPYLRKLKTLPNSEVKDEVNAYEVSESTCVGAADNRNVTETPTQNDKTTQAELFFDEQFNNNYVELEEQVIPNNCELIAAENSNTSPLIRKWMLSQGYSLPEPIDVPIDVEYEDYHISTPNQEIPLHPNTESDANSQLLDLDKVQEVPIRTSRNINIQVTPSPYFSISTSPWEIDRITTPSNQIAQEIVVDDTDAFADNVFDADRKNSEQNQPVEDNIENSSTVALTITTQEMEELPIPQLYIPQGELISGKSVNVRVRLPQGSSHLAVKLWLEDFQTRYLLDGPHLLTNLTPNKNKELEVITKLNIPFGCLEIRLEAIAINTSTQQESHKFTVQRTVIPPNLPNIQLDAILGM